MSNKEQNQKDPSKSYCGKCGRERAPIKMCRCAAVGGGSKEEKSGGESETQGKDNLNSFSQITGAAASQVAGTSTQMSDKSTLVQTELCSDRAVNYEAGLLSIESERLRGNLTFRFNTGLSKAELELSHEFLNAVQTEFDEFKRQLNEQGVSTKDFTTVRKDNELAIRINPANPKHYDAFIKQLVSKNLLPTPNPKAEGNLQSASGDKQQTFIPKSFLTRLERK